MALNIVWSKRASLKFDQIIIYLLNEWGENATKEFIVMSYSLAARRQPGNGAKFTPAGSANKARVAGARLG